MKSANEKVHYFAAYPLKALNLPEEEFESYVRMDKTHATPTVNRIRVLPMANPYKEKDFLDNVKEMPANYAEQRLGN